MGSAVLGPGHVPPARSQRRSRHSQGNHYQSRGNEFEAPRHLLHHTTGAVLALAVTEVTAGCRRTHRPISRAGEEQPGAQAKVNGGPMPRARLSQRLIFWLINGSLILNMVSYVLLLTTHNFYFAIGLELAYLLMPVWAGSA